MTEIGCPLCGNQNISVLFHGHNRRDNIDCSGTYVMCQKCSLVYLHDRPHWEEILKFYSFLDKDVTANTGQVDVAILRHHVEKPVPKWKGL